MMIVRINCGDIFTDIVLRINYDSLSKRYQFVDVLTHEQGYHNARLIGRDLEPFWYYKYNKIMSNYQYNHISSNKYIIKQQIGVNTFKRQIDLTRNKIYIKQNNGTTLQYNLW